MNKNPFVPPPAFTHQQPPLPPGPPPAQPGAPDYSAYWNAASQHQQSHSGAQPTFNPQYPQWSASQPQPATPAKPADQTNLYANYGYGNHWQHQQHHHQQHQHQHQHQYPHPPAPAAVTPVPIPTQPPYNPYQPQAAAGYPQPYVPPTGGVAQPPAPTFRPPQPPQQTFFPPPPPPHHAPQQLPPAKRQRFENPPPPRVQPPPPPMGQPGGHNLSRQSSMTSMHGQGAGGNFSGGGMGRGGGMSGGRSGGMNQGRGGRGGHGGGNRGGFGSNRGGRGGPGSFGGSGRGGGHTGGQPGGGSLRGHRSGDRGSFSSNFNRRGGGGSGGGSFSHHQGNQSHSSSRGHGRGGNMGHGRHNRTDNQNKSNSSTHGGSHKKEEHRRTFTDFKVVGLEIQNLDWRWGHIPHIALAAAHSKVAVANQSVKAEEEASPTKVTSEEEDLDLIVTTEGDQPKGNTSTSTTSDSSTLVSPASAAANVASTQSNAGASRMRIYFHTPPTADDSRPIQFSPQVTRKGKRKKEDDDEDEEVRSAPAPPAPGGNADGDDQLHVTPHVEGRASVAPSATETASEADWLMAAIAEGDADAEAYDDTQGGEDADGVYEIDETMTDTGTHIDEHYPVGEGEGGGEDPAHNPGDGDVAGETNTNAQATETDANGAGHDALPASGSADAATVAPASTEGKAETSDTSAVAASTQNESVVHAAASGSKLPAKPEFHALPAKPMTVGEQDHLPEPPSSPASNTVHSASSTGSATQPEVPTTPKKMQSANAPSANRLSIAYAGGSRRLVINSDVVETMKIFRADGRIEVSMTVERNGDGYKGILIEALSDETNAYDPLLKLTESSESDSTLPPFWCFAFPTKTTLIIYLDKERPLTEAKWLKTGDVQDYLKSTFGRMFWVAGEAVGWEKKIEVVDPDPAPTIQSVLESWSTNSPIGLLTERQRFLKVHLTEPENTLEILLRLVRGERATPFSQNTSAISQPSITGPLLAAFNPDSAHGSQQTHVSLAVVAFVHMAKEFAEKALGLGGKAIVDERVGEIIRSLPSHLLYKSLDGMFKEWRMDKKQGR